MAVILNIETSTNVCSVAVTAEGMVLTHYEDFQGQNHAALLSGYIKACLDYLREKEMTLDAVAVSIGPGSYTGLRIGLSEAKGLAYALNIPLIGIDTLQIMAVSVMFKHDVDPESLFVPMIDARRMEVYTAVYDMALDAGVAYVAGEFFHPDGSGRNTMRMNFSFMTPEKITQGVKLLAELLSRITN